MARFLFGDAVEAGRTQRPFEQVGVVNRCIRIRGDALKSMPLMVSTRDDELVESGEVMDFINCPYPGLTTEDLVEWIDAMVMLTGACYLVIEDAADGTPSRVRPVGSGTCKPAYDDAGDLVGYDYRKPGDKRYRPQRLETQDVIPFTLSNYQSEMLHDGLSQLAPSRRSIDQVFAADTANLESLYNGVEPGLAFDFGGHTPDDEQRDAIYRQMDHNHRGPHRRNRPIVIGGGATVQHFVKKFTEMEFAKLKSMAIVDVCVALGVPPLVAGYSGEEGMGHGKEMEEAHQVFWFVTLLPMAAWIARKLTVHLLPRFQGRSRSFNGFAPLDTRDRRSFAFRQARRHARRHSARVRGVRREIDLFAWFDPSSVDAVRDAAIRRSKEAAIWVEKFGATPADVIESLDLPIPDDHDWQQTWWKPMGLIDVQETSEPLDQPYELNPPSGNDAPADPDDGSADDVTEEGDKSVAVRLTEQHKDHLQRLWEQSWQGLAKAFAAKHNAHVYGLRRETLANFDRAWPKGGETKDAAVLRDLIGEVLFDLVAADGNLVARMGPLLGAAFELGGRQSMTEAA